jgi:hypothetical protein
MARISVTLPDILHEKIIKIASKEKDSLEIIIIQVHNIPTRGVLCT